MSLKTEGAQSIFERRSLEDIHSEIQEVYLADRRPWVVGFSGGKDSTTALQLIWNALAELPPEKRLKPVYVISSDTLVEIPTIVNYIDETLRRINDAAMQKRMPFHAEKVRPLITETFWVNLIGRGYAAPWQYFRWCTDRLKIRPANRFIVQKISRYGEVILVLGVRRSESMTRAQVMSLHQISGSLLSRHSRFAQAFVYTPIKDFTLDDVWFYLLENPSPWGNNNKDLLALYRRSLEETPFVLDDTTPPSGNSRFGCWVCTVITCDQTMESLINSGEEWMRPLLELRDFLKSTQDPAKKPLYRDYKRRQGMVTFKSNGSGIISRGPYKLEFCKEILRRLLKAQMDIRNSGPDPNILLILPEELHEIRRIWRMERGDWQDSLPQIYRQVTGTDLNWVQDDSGTFTARENNILDGICKKYQVPTRLVTKLLDAELQTQGMSRRSSIYSKIEQILCEEWRTEEQILQDTKSKHIHPQKLTR